MSILKQAARLYFSLLAVIVLLFGISLPVFAATYNFLFPITIIDTSNTSRTNLPVDLGFAGQTLINSGYVVTGMDTYMQSGSSSVPHMIDTTNVLTFVPSLPSGGQVTYNLLTGYSPSQITLPIIVGNNGYVTVNDTAALELGNNFSIVWYGYLNTLAASTKNVINKLDAINLYVNASVAGNVTSTIVAADNSSSVDVYTAGAGDNTSIPELFGAPTHWQAVNLSDGDTSYVGTQTDVGIYYQDTYTITSPGLPSYAVIDDVIVHINWENTDGAGNNGVKAVVRLAGTDNVSNLFTATGAGYNTVSASLGKPGGGAWTLADLTTLQIGVQVTTSGIGRDTRVSYVYATIGYHVPVSVSKSGVASGEHLIKLVGDGVNYNLYIEDMTTPISIAPIGAGVPNNANNYLLFQTNVAPYTYAFTVNISGVEKLKFRPTSMPVSTQLLDLAGTKNGDITFGSNSGINIIYGAQSGSQSQTLSSNLSGYQVPPMPMPTNWFGPWGISANYSALPFYDNIHYTATQTGIPESSIYFVGILGLAIACALFVIMFARSIFIGVMTMVIILFVGTTQNIVPGWIPTSFLMINLGIMYLYRQITY